jgi:hypothetical protein
MYTPNASLAREFTPYFSSATKASRQNEGYPVKFTFISLHITSRAVRVGKRGEEKGRRLRD